jgi:hypothetical protein
MYIRRTTPTAEAKIYRSPAILAFLLSDVMRTSTVRGLAVGYVKAGEKAQRGDVKISKIRRRRLDS